MSAELNYHHLHYFWTVAREGSVTRASVVLNLTQPTVSTQVASLEKFFGQPLLRRTGRAVTLTEAGRLVYDYADDIFRLGQELTRVMRAGPTAGRSSRLVVGAADVLPKLIVYRLLEPIYQMPDAVQLQVVEDKADRLLAELALHNLDLVLTDSQVSASGAKVKAYNHPLGSCGAALLAAPALAAKLRANFPRSLNGAPVLLPSEGTTLRRSLDGWFADRGLRPDVRGEFADSALLKVFGQAGVGAFVVPTAIEAEAKRQYNAERVGLLDGLTERFYAVTVERRLRHPAVVKLSETARAELFPAADARG